MGPADGAVLITGCSSGIGRATAERLARGGATVYATARNPESIADLVAKGCRTLALDVCDAGSMEVAVRTIETAEGAIGVLINNAGYSQSGAVETVPIEAVRRQFETNVFGLVRLTQLVLPGMRARRAGKIVNVSSMGGRLTFPGGGVYHASKHAVEAISDALRFELSELGIDVIVIEPGLIRTEFGRTAAASVDEHARDAGPYDAFNAATAKTTVEAYRGPFGRLGGEPDAVAAAIERALQADRAPTRVRVTPSAKLFIALRRLTSDRLWDRLIRTAYPPPRS